MRLTFITLFFCFLGQTKLLAQAGEDFPDSRSPRFEMLYSTLKSEAQTIERSGQVYKVVKENVLEFFWKTVKDTLHQQHQQLTKAHARIDTLANEKNASEKLFAIQNSSMQQILFDSNHISVLGIPFSKGVFILLFLVLVGSLSFSLCVAITRMRYATTVMKENAQVLNYLSSDFEDFKRKSLEKQTKLSRQLQDERNKLNEALLRQNSGNANLSITKSNAG